MRNTVRFQSAAFNSTQVRPHFINACCFGDDVAAWLAEGLRHIGYRVEGPDQEDWGWYLVAHGSGGSYYVNVAYTGDAWQIIVERQRSFCEWMLRKPKSPPRDLTRALHGILTAAPEITVVEWLSVDGRGCETDVGKAP